MKTMLKFVFLTLLAISLSGCLASTYSPVGLDCNWSQGKSAWEMPSACYGP